MEDIEIARSAKLLDIKEIAGKLQIEEDIIQYGKYKAKIDNTINKKIQNKPDGKLILITAISPTPLGEGKTTTSIGLADGMAKIDKKAILALREPSLGPVFGIKGGATGGGMAQVAPMEDINLHFTGDIHAITAANNLLSAMIDNHIYFGNELEFEKVVWRRCLDINDRALRDISIKLTEREEKFDISVASEIMAILCLATDIKDLQRRIGNIIVGYNKENKPITAKDLKADGSLTVLLKDAIKPNLVQTLENNPCIIHGGPFANIAHGCNSIIATKTALKLADYVITESGFGADLGAEKFLDIKCRNANITPDLVICVATIRALKYNGGVSKEDISKENIEALKKGIKNLYIHIENLKNVFGMNVLVAINKFPTDTENEVNTLFELLKEEEVCLNNSWAEGGKGAIDFANKVVQMCEIPSKLKYAYDLEDSLQEKIRKVATKVYRAQNVEFSELALKKLKELENTKFPICIAKTQYSLSDNSKNISCNDKYAIHVNDIILKAGAEFIVVLAGNIFTMPGLPKFPAAEKIGINDKDEIIGIF